RVVVLLQEEQVDLARGSAQRRILKQDREAARLLEIGWQKDIGNPARLAKVVSQVGEKSRTVRAKGIEDRLALEIRPIAAALRRDTEVHRHFLQADGREFATRDVALLHQQACIHDGTTRQVEAREVDP